MGVAPGAHVTVYSQLYEDGCAGTVPETGGSTQAFKDAVAAGPDIIVVPGTTTTTPDVTDAIRSGIVVIGAGGNDGAKVWGSPAASNGVIATGQLASDGSVAATSAWGPQLGLLAPSSTVRSIDPSFSFYGTTDGSSNSSVITAGVIALAMSASPEASGNQILQAVVRTTDGGVHEPTRDETRGFGAVDVRQLMAVDPLSFPDVNPFIRTDADAYPSAQALGLVPDAPAGEAPTTSAVDGEPPAPHEPEDAPDVALLGTVIAAGALVLAAVITAIVVMRRRGRSATTDPAHLQNGGNDHA
jgi:hypothetical protein